MSGVIFWRRSCKRSGSWLDLGRSEAQRRRLEDMTSCFARESGAIKCFKPVEGFWIVYGLEEEVDEEGEGLRFNRRSRTSKYPYRETRSKQVQTRNRAIERSRPNSHGVCPTRLLTDDVSPGIRLDPHSRIGFWGVLQAGQSCFGVPLESLITRSSAMP